MTPQEIAQLEAAPWLSRCDWCGWPLKDSERDGCTAFNCSMRPLPMPSDVEIKQGYRYILAALKEVPAAIEDARAQAEGDQR